MIYVEAENSSARSFGFLLYLDIQKSDLRLEFEEHR